MNDFRRIMWNGMVRTIAVLTAYVISAYLVVIAVLFSLREPGGTIVTGISIVFSPLAVIGLLVSSVRDLRHDSAHTDEDYGLIVGFTSVFLIAAYISLRRFSVFLRSRDPGRCSRCGYDLHGSAGRCPQCGTVALESSGDPPVSNSRGTGKETPPNKAVANAEPALPPEFEFIRRRYIEFVRSATSPWHTEGFKIGAHMFLSTGATMSLIGLPFGLIGFFLAWRIFRKAKKNQKQWMAFAQRAVPIVVDPIMVNSMLRQPGTQAAPGLVVGSFDLDADFSGQYVTDLILKIMRATAEEPRNPEQALIGSLFSDQTYQAHRRRKLPESLSGTQTVYAFDLMINPLLLKDGCIEGSTIACMAEPGDKGRIEVMPWRIGEIVLAVFPLRGAK